MVTIEALESDFLTREQTEFEKQVYGEVENSEIQEKTVEVAQPSIKPNFGVPCFKQVQQYRVDAYNQ